MTTKPEVVGYRYTGSKSRGKWYYQRHYPTSDNMAVTDRGECEALIRLSDYERLQAECSKLRLEVTAYQMRLSEERGRNMVEHEKLRKDAERYRWLEPHLYILQVCTPEGRVFEICIDGAEVPVIGSLRQAIDAATQEPSHDNQ